MAYTMSRAADGKMRVDYGSTSVITDPNTQKMTILDHLAKEVRTIPLPPQAGIPKPPEPPKPGMPAGAPKPPTAPAMPPMAVKDLGKRVVEGLEVHGKEFTMPPLAPPKLPDVKPPAVPGAPQLKPPGLQPPAPPGMPQPPAPGSMVSEVWTSTALQIPILSRISGPFGKQTCHCKNVTGGEPDPSKFLIPSGYKKV